jgi:secondary thiamine-phosphate synthase enzyme
MEYEAMTKSSTVTVRQSPAGEVSATGMLTVRAEGLEVQSADRVQLIDLTERLRAIVRGSSVREGIASLWSMHTTCAVFINESQKALGDDIKSFLETVARRGEYYHHNDPALSDCDRQNADSHLRAMMLGHSVTMQISGGELVVGQWQRVLCGELDGPRTRTVRAQVLGLAG